MLTRSPLFRLRAGYSLNHQFISKARPGTIISHPGPLAQPPSNYYSPLGAQQLVQEEAAGERTVDLKNLLNNNKNNEMDDEDLSLDTTGAENDDDGSFQQQTTKGTIVQPSEMFAGDSVWSPENTIGESWKNLHNLLEATAKEEEQQQTSTAVKNKRRKNFNNNSNSNTSSSLDNLLLENDLRALSQVTTRAEIAHLFTEVMPPSLCARIFKHPEFEADNLEEIFLHLGMDVELRSNTRKIYKVSPPTSEEIAHMCKRIGSFGDDGRACVNNTLHRVSCWMSRSGHTVGLTIRIGRFVPFAASSFLQAAIKGSLLLLSPPSCGKTTCLRDLATQLARLPQNFRVVVIDTSNEIGGDSEVPLPYLHRVRRLQVPKRSLQLNYMIQAVQNHAPDFVVIDEIANKEEAECAVSMSQRGIRLVATAHASTLHSLLQNSELNPLVGGVAHAFLSNEERRLRKKTKKTILERMSSSPFRTVVELQGRNEARIIRHVNDCVDLILDTGSLDGADVTKNWVADRVKLDDPSHVIEQQEIDLKRDVEQEVIATTETSAPHLPPPKSASATSGEDKYATPTTTNSNQYNNNYNHHQQQTKPVICYRCGEKGHRANVCPLYSKMKNYNNNNNNNNNSNQQERKQNHNKNARQESPTVATKPSPSDNLFAEIDEEIARPLSKSTTSSTPTKKQWWDQLEDDLLANDENKSESGNSNNNNTKIGDDKVTSSQQQNESLSTHQASLSSTESNDNKNEEQWWDKLERSIPDQQKNEMTELNKTIPESDQKLVSKILATQDEDDGYFDIKFTK